LDSTDQGSILCKNRVYVVVDKAALKLFQGRKALLSGLNVSNITPSPLPNPSKVKPNFFKASNPHSKYLRAMAERRLISSGFAFEDTIGYSRAVVTGSWIIVSGTTG
jgi:hypothetical protein